jgi:hypothetical protein
VLTLLILMYDVSPTIEVTLTMFGDDMSFDLCNFIYLIFYPKTIENAIALPLVTPLVVIPVRLEPLP